MRRALLLAVLALGACAAEPPEPRPAAASARPACDGSFRVTNASPRIISRLYLRDAALTNWGSDLLGQEVLAAGGTSNFRAPSGGVYDMRLIFADRQTLERRRVNICSATPIQVGNFAINAP